MATASEITGAAALLLAAAIEMVISDEFYQGIIAGMQADGNRQALTDSERQAINAHLDATSKDAQDAIDDLPGDGS